MFNNEHLTRQMDLIPMEALDLPVTIIGAGAVGSWVTLALAKMGFHNLTVYDDDKVDTVNLNSQFYPLAAVGRPKVAALAEMVRAFTGLEIDTQQRRYEGKGLAMGGVVVSAVDSMTARKMIWEAHKDRAPFCKAIVDPRMGAEEALLYVMNPMSGVDQRDYEKTLYSESSAVSERCTAKATIYTANLLAGLVCKAVKDIAIGKQDHLRVAQWNIANNQCFLFNRKPS